MRPGSPGWLILAGAMLLMAVAPVSESAGARPVLPCGAEPADVAPKYAPLGAPPAVAVWHNITLAPDTCLGQAKGHQTLAIALAVRFEHRGTLEDLAARAGAISATRAIRYWSVTDGEYRPLISEAFALDGPDTHARRPDFTASEVLSGRTLYFAQNDTRSTGLNLYSLKARRLGPDELAIEVVNITDIRFLVFTMFGARSLVSLHIFRRLDGQVWGYYGLSTIRGGVAGGHEKSFVNRAAAYQRFMIGAPTGKAPPLAP